MLYNVVVRADPSQPMLRERMLEGTDADVRDIVAPEGSYDLQILSRLPAILTEEFYGREATATAVIGYMDEPSLNPVISKPVMVVPSRALIDKGVLDEWGSRRTRWFVLRGDPYRLFASCSLTAPKDEVPAQKPNQIAVMMPFNDDPEIDPVFGAIRNGASSLGYEAKRVDQEFTPTDIVDDVHRLIRESSAVVADVSGRNANVMYELGYALGKEKPVVMITSDDPGNLPFDVGHRRAIRYERSSRGLEDLSNKIVQSLLSI